MQVLMPIPLGQEQNGELAPRRPIGPETVIGFIDNGRVRSAEMLRAVGDAFVHRGLAVEYFTLVKPDSVTTPDERAALVARADIVIAGVGSCGACTARTIHDAILCDTEGTPATAILTEVFAPVASAMSESLGLAGYRYVTVPHPIWTRSPEWIAETAEDIVDRLVERVAGTDAGRLL